MGAFGSSERSAASQEEARRLGGRQMTKSFWSSQNRNLCVASFFLVTCFFSKTAANNSANAVVMPFYTFFDLYITGCFETVQLGSSCFYWGGVREGSA